MKSDDKMSEPFHLSDTVLAGLAAIAATVVGMLIAVGAPLGVSSWVIAAVMGAVVAGLGLGLKGLSNRGVMLTLSLRVLCLLVISVALTAIVTLAWKPVSGSDRGDDWHPEYKNLQASSEAQLKAAQLELMLVRAELAQAREPNALGSRRDALQLMVDIATVAVEKDRIAKLDLDRLRKNPPPPAPVPPDGGNTSKPSLKEEEPPLLKAVEIPPEHVARLQRTVEGRNLIGHIISNVPLFGPAIAALLGGGGTIREDTVVILTTLQDGKRIPTEEELYRILGVAADPAKLAGELKAVAQQAADRGILSHDQLTAIEKRLDEIVVEVRHPLDPDVKAAVDQLAHDLEQTHKCNPDVTKPAFVAFPTRRSKLRALAVVKDSKLRDCLSQYPPNLGADDVPARAGAG
jgi:hypothetical protein